MSKIDDLIKKYCPNGVELKNLEDVCNIAKGVQFNKKDMNETGSYPVINGGINPSGFIEQYNSEADTITISQGGASAGYVNFLTSKFWAGAHCYTIKPYAMVLNRFLYHFIKAKEYKLQECQYGAGIPALAKSAIASLQIPVPPLEVQREIVQVLDSFTMLTAELSAELSARKKQYEFYRDQLLTFNNEVAYTPLSELFDFRNGLSKGKEFFGRGTPFVSFSDVFNHRFLHKSDIKSLVECSDDEKQKLHIGRGDVLFTRTSETAEDVGRSSVMLDDIGDCVFNGFSIRATPKTDKLIPEYCAYCFDTYSFRNYVTKNCSFTTRASLTGATIAEYKLPVPSINVQKRIVKVLDNFEAICSDLKIGLPAEIELRKKQYEYYRDMLLSFEPIGTVLAKQASKQASKQ